VKLSLIPKHRFALMFPASLLMCLFLASCSSGGGGNRGGGNGGQNQSYTTSFPATENPISEGGKWINGGTAGLDWMNIDTVTGEAYGTDTGTSSDGYNDSTAVLQGDGPWGRNQYTSAVVHIGTINNTFWPEIELRLNTTIVAHSITGYECNYSALNNGSQYFVIVRWNGPEGNFTPLTHVSGTALANGDTISCQNVNGVISMYHGATLLASVTDTTYTAGSPGIGTDLGTNGGDGTNANFGFSSFTASDRQRSP
jgi:hypothetical protein